MGRNIIFNKNTVIDQITHLFFVNGYNNTSLSKIEEVTQVKKASLHSFFGTKDKLFKLSLEHYYKSVTKRWQKMGSGMEFLIAFFDRLLTPNSKRASGCLIMNSMLEFSTLNNKELKLCVSSYFENIQQKLQSEIENVEHLNKTVDSAKLAKSLTALAFSIREVSKVTSDKDYFALFSSQIESVLTSIQTFPSK